MEGPDGQISLSSRCRALRVMLCGMQGGALTQLWSGSGVDPYKQLPPIFSFVVGSNENNGCEHGLLLFSLRHGPKLGIRGGIPSAAKPCQ